MRLAKPLLVSLLLVFGCLGVLALTSQSNKQFAAPPTVPPTRLPITAYKTIDPRELQSYADKHIDEPICVTGKIFNIDKYVVQLLINGRDDYDAYLEMTEDASGVYIGDTVSMCGIVKGFKSYKNKDGNNRTEPLITVAFIKGR